MTRAETGLAGLCIAHVALLLATIAPILSVEFPPLGDLPNHLARLHILARFQDSPELQANYEIVPTLSPYLLVDWMLTPPARIWSVYDVGRCFVAATMMLTFGGILALSVALFHRLTIWPALALPIFYNHALSWGFMNFAFGVGLMFVMLAIWFRLRGSGAATRFACLALASAILYLAHMLAFGMFALIVVSHAGYSAYRQHGWAVSRWLPDVAPVALPVGLTLAVYFYWLANDGQTGETITKYGDLIHKPSVIVSPTMFFDGIADSLLLLVYMLGALMLVRRGALRLAPGMGFPLAAFALVCVFMPDTLFGVWGVDFRFPPVLLMLLIASTEPKMLVSGSTPPVLLAAVVAIVVFRAATLWPAMQIADRQIQELREAIRGVDKGARVLVSSDNIGEGLPLPERAYLHLPLLAVIERDAFVPNLFTGVTQVRASARNVEFDAAAGPILRSADIAMGLDPAFVARYRNHVFSSTSRVYWADWAINFDYLIRIDPVPMAPEIASRLQCAPPFSYFELCKVRAGG